MQKFRFLLILVVMFFAWQPASHADNGPEESENGIWIQKYSIKGVDKKFYYAVDKVTQLCFSIVRIGTGAGHTPIPCSHLKKRPEWKRIILWE